MAKRKKERASGYTMDDQEQPPLRLGMLAPNFRARTTLGPLTLSDLKGRWVVLFSHPADFTPVCTSEFIAFSRAQPQFDQLGCQLLGLSVDSLSSHLAWMAAIARDLATEIRFPVIEDPSMAIARAYGMLDLTARDSSTVRSTFILDPDGRIQAILSYPLCVGRSVSEILRTVAALQRAARGDALTPANWHPGDPIFHPPSTTIGEVAAQGEQLWYHALYEDDAL